MHGLSGVVLIRAACNISLHSELVILATNKAVSKPERKGKLTGVGLACTPNKKVRRSRRGNICQTELERDHVTERRNIPGGLPKTLARLFHNYLSSASRSKKGNGRRSIKWQQIYLCSSITLLAFLWIVKWLEKATTHLSEILGIKLNTTIPTPFYMEPLIRRNRDQN